MNEKRLIGGRHSTFFKEGCFQLKNIVLDLVKQERLQVGSPCTCACIVTLQFELFSEFNRSESVTIQENQSHKPENSLVDSGLQLFF